MNALHANYAIACLQMISQHSVAMVQTTDGGQEVIYDTSDACRYLGYTESTITVSQYASGLCHVQLAKPLFPMRRSKVG